MKTNDPAEKIESVGTVKRAIHKCVSCGQSVLKHDRETFDRIGLCEGCAQLELEPFVISLSDVFSRCGAPETLEIAKGRGWGSYEEALLELALSLYEAGWRLTRTAHQSESDEQV